MMGETLASMRRRCRLTGISTYRVLHRRARRPRHNGMRPIAWPP